MAALFFKQTSSLSLWHHCVLPAYNVTLKTYRVRQSYDLQPGGDVNPRDGHHKYRHDLISVEDMEDWCR